jgi:hypothetical protein
MEVTKYGGGVRHVKFLLHLSSNLKIPAFAEAPACRTRLWQAGLRAGRQMSKECQGSKSKIVILA